VFKKICYLIESEKDVWMTLIILANFS